MKKIIASILSMVMVLSLATPIYATEETGTEYEVYTGSTVFTSTGEATVSFDKQSSFTVRIPKKISVSGSANYAYFYIHVNGDVRDEDTITVRPKSTEFNVFKTTVPKSNQTPLKGTYTQDKQTFTGAQISPTFNPNMLGSNTARVSAVVPNLTAGNWEGTMNFEIIFTKGASDTQE